jgi:hypothetical protein
LISADLIGAGLIAAIVPAIEVEPGGRQPGMTARGELGTIQDEERWRDGVEAESVAFP